VPGGMGDHQRQRHRSGRELRGDAAGPEHGDFTGADGDRIAEFRCCQVANADVTIIAEVYRRAVGQVKARGDLHGPHGLLRGHRPHGHHQLRGERPGRPAIPLGNIHGHVFALLDVADGQARGQHGVFKREAAAQQKAHHAAVGIGAHIRHLGLESAVLVDAVAREISAQVRTRRDARLEPSGFQSVQERTGFGIAHAEQ